MNFLLNYPFIALGSVFGVVAIALAFFIHNLYRRWRRVFGKTPSAEAIQEVLSRLQEAEGRIDTLEPRVKILERIGTFSIQKVGFLRFNPFEHTGGDQSFSVALLDRNDNGIILSSLYTREGTRMYAKEVEAGKAKHPLSQEETSVLSQALEE